MSKKDLDVQKLAKLNQLTSLCFVKVWEFCMKYKTYRKNLIGKIWYIGSKHPVTVPQRPHKHWQAGCQSNLRASNIWSPVCIALRTLVRKTLTGHTGNSRGSLPRPGFQKKRIGTAPTMHNHFPDLFASIVSKFDFTRRSN